MAKVWFVYRPVGLAVFMGIAYLLTKLFDWLLTESYY